MDANSHTGGGSAQDSGVPGSSGESSVIIVQSPLRISFFGGGTDFPDFFRKEGGCVLTSTIDKYIFVTIKQDLTQNCA